MRQTQHGNELLTFSFQMIGFNCSTTYFLGLPFLLSLIALLSFDYLSWNSCNKNQRCETQYQNLTTGKYIALPKIQEFTFQIRFAYINIAYFLFSLLHLPIELPINWRAIYFLTLLNLLLQFNLLSFRFLTWISCKETNKILNSTPEHIL